jgi:hypothetical protein
VLSAVCGLPWVIRTWIDGVPAMCELSVNLKRAKELGLAMPDSLPSRADKISE